MTRDRGNTPMLAPLSHERHGDRFWRKARGYGHARERALVPITHRELPRAVGALPLAFTSGGEGRYVLVAVLGPEPRRNVFIDLNDRWRGGYVPAYLRAHPFYLAERGEERHVVSVDEASDCLSDDPLQGEPLFTESAEPSAELQRVVDFLREVARSRVRTDRAVQALAEHEVLEPWQASVATEAGRRTLQGLYRVSERRLGALSPEALADLRDRGALAVAYGQLMAQAHLPRLGQLAQARAREERKRVPAVNEVFGEDDLESRIDWDALDFGDDAGGGEDPDAGGESSEDTPDGRPGGA